MQSCDTSLRRLRTDHIDLYQLHRPSSVVPQAETLAAFDELVQAGKVRHVGCSTHPAWMVMEALAVSDRDGRASYATEQPPYNLLDRRAENELLPLCRAHGLGVLPWSPLGGGVLAGRYADPEHIPDDFRGRPAAHSCGPGSPPGRSKWPPGSRSSPASGASPRPSWPCSGSRTSPTSPRRSSVPVPSASSRTRSGILDVELDDDARAACDELVHAGSAVADFYNTSGWMREQIA